MNGVHPGLVRKWSLTTGAWIPPLAPQLRPFKSMTSPSPQESDLIHSEAFLHGLMKRQLKLSIGCAVAFFSVLVVLPLLNYYAADFMAQRVAGFTLTWLVLGILFFPYVWVIAKFFINRSMALEAQEVRQVSESSKN